MNLLLLTGLLGGPPDSFELGGTGNRVQRKDTVFLKAWPTSCPTSNDGIWDGLYVMTLALNQLSDINRS